MNDIRHGGIPILRAGSFDDETDEMRNDAINWVLKAYGPTARQRQAGCHCPPCRVEQEAREADYAAFVSHIESMRTALLTPRLLFND